MSIHPPTKSETAAGVLGASQAAAVANLATGNVDSTHTQLLTSAQQTAAAALATNGEDYLSSGTWPTIVANAATISPGPYGPGRVTIPSTLTLGANATVSIDKAGSPVTGMAFVLCCRALALGFTITIANNAAGGNGGNLVVVPASLTKPIYIPFIFNGVDWIGPNLGGPIFEVVA